MGNQVSQQLLVFGQSILLGLCAGLLYDLLRPFRLRLPRLTGLLDGLYCLLTGTAVFFFLLRGRTGSCGALLCWGPWAEPYCFSACSRSCCGPCGPFGRIRWRIWPGSCPYPFCGQKFF